ncbi:hypothetical protein ES703_55644 [subsurface metagenome]
MKKKIVWLVVSCLMVLSLVMASCGPAEEEVEVGEEPEEEVEVVEEPEEEVEKEVEEVELLPPDVPKYGGTHVFVSPEPMGFDPYYTMSVEVRDQFITHDELMGEDWTKGPAGTNETDWVQGFVGRLDLLTGELAESWEMPDDETIIFHIRKGVRFWDKYPANGREFTAKDAAWEIERQWTAPRGFLRITNKPEDALVSATALDKYTLELKVPAQVQGLHLVLDGEQIHMSAPEIVDVYGDMKDWRNAIGTGPYMVTDYVVGSSMTFERNPNYWRHDPLHPENQLPYLDTLKTLYITDASTRLAALRTGKIDWSMPISWEDAELLMEQCPELKYKRMGGGGAHLWGRIDKEELPFKDIKVRQALNLAVNQQEIVDEYYEGNADLLVHPFPTGKTWEPFYTPLEEMPTEPTTPDSRCGVQELFEYNPEKAKQLLTEAGYPGGFQTEVVCSSAGSDFLSIIKDYLIDVGVDMEIKVLESGVFRSVGRGRTHEEMIYYGSPTSMFPWKMHSVRKESFDCPSYFEHEYTRAIYDELNLYYGKDADKVAELLKKSVPFELEQSAGVWMPGAHSFNMWWPWMQNFHGEGTHLGYDNQYCITHYIWIDEALKESMGY